MKKLDDLMKQISLGMERYHDTALCHFLSPEEKRRIVLAAEELKRSVDKAVFNVMTGEKRE